MTKCLPNSVLITGPSESGIGAQSAIFLAAGRPKLIILAGRSESKIRPVMDEIRRSHPDVPTTYVKLDLADNSSVRKAAQVVNSQTDKLDILINNAGGGFKALMFTRTSQGLISYSYGDQRLHHLC